MIKEFIEALKFMPYTFIHGKWEWGWESYKGKPMLGVYYVWYDGPNYAFHLGKLWVCCH